MDSTLIAAAADLLVKICSEESRAAGWHNDPRTGLLRTSQENTDFFPTRIALCHSELSEALEGHRKNSRDDHLPERRMAEVELADALIRICDLAGVMGYDLGGAVSEKLRYNAVRQDHRMENRQKDDGKAY